MSQLERHRVSRRTPAIDLVVEDGWEREWGRMAMAMAMAMTMTMTMTMAVAMAVAVAVAVAVRMLLLLPFVCDDSD